MGTLDRLNDFKREVLVFHRRRALLESAKTTEERIQSLAVSQSANGEYKAFPHIQK